MRTLSPLELAAQVTALERRVRHLQKKLDAPEPPMLDELHTVETYFWSLRLLRGRSLAEEEAYLAAAAALALDEPRLLAIAKRTGDPYPWAPLLRVLRAAAALHPSPIVVRASTHLRELAENLLELQGLGIVPVDDILLGACTPSVAADALNRVATEQVAPLGVSDPP